MTPVAEDPAGPQNRWDNLFRFFVREHDVAKWNPPPRPSTTSCNEPTSQPVQKGPLPEDLAYYRSVWLTLSKTEQLALYQLAKEGFINAKNPELPGLLACGVIVRDPELKLADEVFKGFVLFAFRPEDLKSHEQTEPDSPWNKFKVPFQTILLVVALLLFLTQQELFTFAVQVMGVFAAAVPALLKFFDMFQKSPVNK